MGFYSPHISSGRVPTTKGLKFFLDGLLEIGDVSKDDRNKIGLIAAGSGNRIDDICPMQSKFIRFI